MNKLNGKNILITGGLTRFGAPRDGRCVSPVKRSRIVIGRAACRSTEQSAR